MKFLSKWFLFIILILTFPGLLPPAPPAVARPSLSPLNPVFTQYLRDRQLSGITGSVGEVYGYAPSPLDLSHLTGSPLPRVKKLEAPPARFDLRPLGKLTPVKDQKQNICGSCWAFATYGSLESTLLPTETRDFSENNLKNTHGFDWGPCEQGNGYIATAYLARWSGPLNETEDPYDPYSANPSPVDLPAQKHLQEALILPDRAGPLDNNNLKEAVLAYGAVSTLMHIQNREPFYNSANHAYFFNGGEKVNHAVAIVGWDDHFPKERFSIVPPGGGAFIARNSWGKDWGEEGYFYVSYFDAKIGTENFLFPGVEPPGNFRHIYQYDPLGWTLGCSWGSGSTSWFANIFTAAADDSLKAVSFYTAAPDSPYEIYVFLNAVSGPVSGVFAGSKAGTLEMPGYHTVLLDSAVPLRTGQKFSVVVRLTTPGYDYPIPLEYPHPGYSSQARANPGESYASGNGIYWDDVTKEFPNTNVCLKAFTGNVFADVPLGYWAEGSINALYHEGVTAGYGDGRFGPGDLVSREQMTVFLIRVLHEVPPDGYCGGANPFADVGFERWSCKYVKRLVELGITSGVGGGMFDPEGMVTREQMAIFITRALNQVPADGYCGIQNPFSDVPADCWSCIYVKKLAELGITTGYGDGRFGPGDFVTRAQMAVFLSRAFLEP